MIKDLHPYRILVIEDNPGDYTLVEEYLLDQVASPTISQAVNYTQAAAILKVDNLFDVILLDLTLPDKSGQQLITDILAIASGKPVIVLTGHANIDFSIQSISLGISDYLLKDDLNATSLYKSIVYCIERKKRMQELEASEKRYGDLFHHSPQPMWVFEPQTLRFIKVNKAAIIHYGYTENELLNMTLLDLLHGEDREAAREMIATHGTSPAILSGRSRHLKKSKEVVVVEMYVNAILLDQKNFCLAIAVDITEKNQVESKITNAIIKTQEDERYEIGAELHDNVCQILAASQITLGMIKNDLNPSVVKWYEQSSKYIALATEEIRNLSHRLAPAFYTETTLEDAFQVLLGSFNPDGKYKIDLFFDDAARGIKINRELQLNLYRILQEQLRNILKYAKGSLVEVDVVIKNDNLMMRVSDNGVGFDPGAIKSGIGLSNIRRRAELFSGKFDIVSSPGEGCEIMVEIPLRTNNAV